MMSDGKHARDGRSHNASVVWSNALPLDHDEWLVGHEIIITI